MNRARHERLKASPLTLFSQTPGLLAVLFAEKAPVLRLRSASFSEIAGIFSLRGRQFRFEASRFSLKNEILPKKIR